MTGAGDRSQSFYAAAGQAVRLLEWYAACGADEALDDAPHDRRQAQGPGAVGPGAVGPGAGGQGAAGPGAAEPDRTSRPQDRMPPLQPNAPAPGVTPIARPETGLPAAPSGTAAIVAAAEAWAAAAPDLAALAAAVDRFDRCGLRLTATHTVFGAGAPGADTMWLGDMPGPEEDRTGEIFGGAPGRLLDRMLAAAGFARERVYLGTAVFWRPPGNRAPTPAEIAICRPFVMRQIALARPKLLILLGQVAVASLIPENPGLARLRGRWTPVDVTGLEQPLQAIAMYHPRFLLSTPERKSDAWQDLLNIKSRMQVLTK